MNTQLFIALTACAVFSAAGCQSSGEPGDRGYYDSFEVKVQGQLLDSRSGQPIDLAQAGPEITVCVDATVLDSQGRSGRVVLGRTYPYFEPACFAVRNKAGREFEVLYPENPLFGNLRAVDFELTDHAEALYRMTLYVQPRVFEPRGSAHIGSDAYYDLADFSIRDFSFAVSYDKAKGERFDFAEINAALGGCWLRSNPWRQAEGLRRLSETEYTFSGADQAVFELDPTDLRDFYKPVETTSPDACVEWTKIYWEREAIERYDDRFDRTLDDFTCTLPGPDQDPAICPPKY